jgi:hypothetical protein
MFESTGTTELVEEVVDGFLEFATSCDPFIQPHDQDCSYSGIPEFEFDVYGLVVKVSAGYPWSDWTSVLEQRRPDWLLNPCDKDWLTEDVVDEILTFRHEIEATSSILEHDGFNGIWDKLSDTARESIDAGISEEEWRISGRDDIRRSLIASISEVLDETIEAWKQELDGLTQFESLLTNTSAGPGRGIELDAAKAALV